MERIPELPLVLKGPIGEILAVLEQMAQDESKEAENASRTI